MDRPGFRLRVRTYLHEIWRRFQGWRIGLLLLACLGVAFHAGGAACYLPPDGLVAWWPGDGTVGDIAGDNSGTLHGGATASGVGVVGPSFDFDGTNGYVQIPDAPGLRPANLTIEAWVWFSSLDSLGSGSSPAGEQFIIFKQNTRTDSFEGFALTKARVAGGDVFRFAVSSAGGDVAAVQSTTMVSTGQWYHVAAARGADFIEIFVNGLVEAGTTVGFAQDYGLLPLYFGTSGQASRDHKFNGLLDEVSLFDRVIGGDAIAAIYAAGAAGKCRLPAISVQPSNQVAMVFSNASLSVTAAGLGPFRYQWLNGNTPLTDSPHITGANGPVLTIVNPQFADSGRYSVIVSNAFASVVSSNATLTVVPIFVWGAEAFAPPAEATNIVAITGGTSHNLALRADGSVLGWGENSLGQVNIPPEATNIVGIAAGEWHSMALRQDGTVVSWGWENYNDTKPPADATNLVAIAVGQFHSLGLRWNGTVVGWGSEFVGEIYPPPDAINVIALAAWGWWGSPIDPHSLALRADGRVVGWGYNGYGQNSPPANATDVIAIAAGKRHSLALRADGSVLGWGDNSYGQCTIPARVTNAVAIGAGEFHSLALLQNGTVVGWGYDTNGDTTTPANLSNVVAIAVRHYRNLALVQETSSPKIWRQPPDRVVSYGETALLIAEAVGTPPVRFQWYFKGLPLTGQTRNSLLLANLEPSREGNYQLVASNDSGSVTSRVATLRIVPSFITQPSDQTLTLGSTASFSVAANAWEPLSYQWYFNGAPLTDDGRISGATSASLTISNVQRPDAGAYQVVVSTQTASNLSAVATLTLLLPPIITTQPAGFTVSAGKNVNLAVTATGTDPLAYQWRKEGGSPANDGHVTGANSSTLAFSYIQTNHSGAYDVVITNNYGAVTSAVASITVLQREPNITLQPSDQYILPTRTAAFSVAVEGASPLRYQWFHDGAALFDDGRLTGTTADAFTVAKVQTGDIGRYWVVISNAWGAVTSMVATLTISTARYVNVNNPYPLPPYTNWATAAQTIQDAVDVSLQGDEVTVTNGTYATGGRAVFGTLINRVAVDRPVTVRSVNGPQFTTIQGRKVAPYSTGDGAIRCVYLTNGAVLAGFTLSGGATRRAGDWLREQSGGGVQCESVSAVISNCTITANVASTEGGGVMYGTLHDCTLSGNVATGPCGGSGGGAAYSTLTRCTLSRNWANWGGGADHGTLNHCQLIGNSARDFSGSHSSAAGGVYYGSLTNCTLINNSAALHGGGATWGTLVNCLITGNFAPYGGGAAAGLLINCTVVGNSAPFDTVNPGGIGGGIDACTAYNSILVQNQSGFGGSLNNASYSTLFFCCTPYPEGVGTITDDPAFVDSAAGNYRLQAGSPCINAGTNGAIGITVDLDGAPRIVNGTVDIGAYERQQFPFIVVPPASQSVLIHSNALFTVLAIGDGPLSYQWQKDGVDLADNARITGAATASLTISSLALEDAGSYRVVVSNALGTVTSAAATLTPLGLPFISNSPLSRSAPAGTNVTFSVGASGLGTLSYQWRFGAVTLPAGTNSSLSLTNVQAAVAGDYDVIVANDYGAVNSAVATLTVLPAAPQLTLQPASRVASVGQSMTFATSAKGTEPLFCQWQKDGSDIAGATGFMLTLNNVNASFAGLYRAVVSNAVGFLATTNARLSVVPVLVWGITNNPQLLLSATVPSTATNVVALAAGRTAHSLPCLALRADGSLVAWGYSAREPGVPPSATNVAAIAIGDAGYLDQGSGAIHSLMLRRDGTVVAWGNNTFGQATVPPGATNIVAIAAGAGHSLALAADGTVLAWGQGVEGQTNVPSFAAKVIAVAAGAYHSLALLADGTVAGWGRNTLGQATRLVAATNIIAIAAGGNQSIALRADGKLLGLMVTNADKTVLLGDPPSDATNLLAISAGELHVLGIRADRSVVGWGDNRYGQIVIPTNAVSVLTVAAGGYHSLALVGDPTPPRPTLTVNRIGHDFILLWEGAALLQSATNLAGPYLDVPGALSPFTNDQPSLPARFLRLRLPQ